MQGRLYILGHAVLRLIAGYQAMQVWPGLIIIAG